MVVGIQAYTESRNAASRAPQFDSRAALNDVVAGMADTPLPLKLALDKILANAKPGSGMLEAGPEIEPLDLTGLDVNSPPTLGGVQRRQVISSPKVEPSQ